MGTEFIASMVVYCGGTAFVRLALELWPDKLLKLPIFIGIVRLQPNDGHLCSTNQKDLKNIINCPVSKIITIRADTLTIIRLKPINKALERNCYQWNMINCHRFLVLYMRQIGLQGNDGKWLLAIAAINSVQLTAMSTPQIIIPTVVTVLLLANCENIHRINSNQLPPDAI